MFIYYIDSDQILTQKGIYSRNVFFDDVYRYTGSGKEGLAEYLNQENNFNVLGAAPVIKDGFIEKRFVTILNSVPIREKPKANLVVLVDEEYLRTFVDSTGFVSKGSAIAIVDGDLEIITGSIGESLRGADLASLIEGYEPAPQRTVSQKRIANLRVIRVHSQVVDWHYLVISPVNLVSSQAASIRNITIWICVVLVLICFLLTWVISMNLYSPIKEIVTAIGKRRVDTDDTESSKDELNYIFSHVKYVMERNKSLDDNMKQVEPAYRDQYLRSLILGIPNRVINEGSSGVRLNWPHRKFVVIVVQTYAAGEFAAESRSLDSSTDDLLSYLEEVLHAKDGLVGVITYIGKSRLTLLVNLESEIVLDELLVDIDPQLRTHTVKNGSAIALGVGDFCVAMSQLNGSYEEALKALEPRKVHARVQTLRHGTIRQTQHTTPTRNYSMEREEQLIYGVLSGDDERVKENLNSILAENIFGDSTYRQLSLVFDNLTTTVNKILDKDREIKRKIEDLDILERYSQARPENLRDMRAYVYDVYGQLTELFLRSRQENVNELKERLIRYIQDNYDNPEISLGKIADDFDLNPKYVSRYFKEQTGTNYHDFLNLIRTKKAKELLRRNEKQKIVEISKLVGYYNVNTFIAAFRRGEGVTPSMYRKLSK